MIHHAGGSVHSAHLEVVLCSPSRVSSCAWPILKEGKDGKCNWCRGHDDLIDGETLRERHDRMFGENR